MIEAFHRNMLNAEDISVRPVKDFAPCTVRRSCEKIFPGKNENGCFFNIDIEILFQYDRFIKERECSRTAPKKRRD